MHRNKSMGTTARKACVRARIWFAGTNTTLALKKKVTPVFSLALLGLLIGGFSLWAPATFAYTTWSDGCQNCHGGFKGGNYSSITTDDPASWGQDLMDGHVSRFSLGCSDCHSGSNFTSVTLDTSNSGVTCSSCHGRVEDDAGTGLGGSMPSAGLRQRHYNNGVQICAGCHAADSNPATFTPVGEDVAPPTFISKGIDPCNDTTFGSAGLDNDGDGPRDSADTDCQAPVDNPPTAVISAPANGLVGETLTFDGSGSSDDGAIISYTWTFGDGGSASGMTTTYTYSAAGSYTVSLEVCDNATTSQCNTTTHTITISDIVVDNPPTAVITGPASGTAGDTLSFDGSGSTDDGAIVSYAWTVDGTPTGSNMTMSHLFSTAGSYTISLEVCDNATTSQCSTATHTVTITDIAVDNPPTAIITGPASGTVGDTLSFDGSGSTDDGTLVSYDWTVDGAAAGSNMTLSWQFITAGGFSVNLTVCDDAAQCDTASHTVTIREQAGNGEAMYMNDCASCHGDPSTDEPAPDGHFKVTGARTCSIQGSIYGTSVFPDGVETMRFLQGMLSNDQIQEISDYLNTFSVNGMQRYITTCSSCHGQDARGGRTDEDVRNSDAEEIEEAIHDETEMRFLDCLPDGDIHQIGKYLSDNGNDKDEKDDDDKDDHKRDDDNKHHEPKD